MIRGVAAAASEPWADAAAREALEAGGTAVDAAVAGYFAGAGAHPGPLLGPVVALVVGGGAGSRAFDGRCVQPGLGIPRPRGFLSEDEIPAAARAAVPRGPAFVLLLHQLHGRIKLARLAGSGVTEAEARGAKRRAALVRAVGDAGAVALRQSGTLDALLRAGGTVAGGLLTAADLESAAPADRAAATTSTSVGPAYHFGGAEGDGAPTGLIEPGSLIEIVVAGDQRGQLAALAYVVAAGVPVPELEVDLHAVAEPVMRGVQRRAPGSERPARVPLGVVDRGAGVRLAFGVADRCFEASAGVVESLASAILVEEGLRALVQGAQAQAAQAQGAHPGAEAPAPRVMAVAAERAGARQIQAL